MRSRKIDPNSLVALAGLTVAILLLIFSIVIPEFRHLLGLDKKDHTSIEYTEKNELNQAEIAIKQLLSFVDKQKDRLSETQKAISTLRSEKDKLQPIVEANRAIVDAIFRLQEERDGFNKWRERSIGFFSGIISSIIASFVSPFIISKFNKNAERKPEESVKP